MFLIRYIFYGLYSRPHLQKYALEKIISLPFENENCCTSLFILFTRTRNEDLM